MLGNARKEFEEEEKWRSTLKVGSIIMIDNSSYGDHEYQSFSVTRTTASSIWADMYGSERRFKRSTGRGVGCSYQMKRPTKERNENERRHKAVSKIRNIVHDNRRQTITKLPIEVLEEVANKLDTAFVEYRKTPEGKKARVRWVP